MKQRLKYPIHPASIRQIVKQHFGADATVALATMSRGGLFNTLYKLQLGDGRTVVLRIAPPREKPLLACEAGLLQREIHFTRALQKYHLPIPRVLCTDFSKRVIDRNYIFTEYCPGYNAFYRLKMLTPPEQDALYGELGRYAKRIHAIENPAGWFGAPAPLKPFRKWSEFVRWHALTLLQELHGKSFMALPSSLGVPTILDKMQETPDEIKTPRLIHGDLWLRNILIARRQGTYTISAILDWDRCTWGDPYFEWILHGLDLRPAFWQEYGTPDTNPRSHEKRKLLYKALGCLQASLEDAVHFNLRMQALQMLHHSLANFTELSKAL